jgi:hypothetical protein
MHALVPKLLDAFDAPADPADEVPPRVDNHEGRYATHTKTTK